MEPGQVSARTLALALAMATSLATLAGCAAPTFYNRGSSQKFLYEMYAEPGNATPETQLETLTREVQEARSKGQRIAPGIQAHLGYMYFLVGDVGAATAQFAAEKAAFPESATFVDGMLARLGAAQ